jgi:hypothetical protein
MQDDLESQLPPPAWYRPADDKAAELELLLAAAWLAGYECEVLS